MLNLFDELDRQSDDKNVIIKAPFPYPGGKSRSIEQITQHLPSNHCYVSVFGGSGCDILARKPSRLEVFNDRYSAITDFYRVIRDEKLCEKLIERLDLTIHSREEFYWCKETWEKQEDIVERAARWYYLTMYSFTSVGRCFGRSVKPGTRFAGKLRNHLEDFPIIHERFKHVQIENLDWYDCVMDYDDPDTVFYLDPDYVDTTGVYKHSMSIDDHRRMLDVIFSLEGFVAVSGYPNPLYDNQNWDGRHEWEVNQSIRSSSNTAGNQKEGLAHDTGKEKVIEVLWIKESK